MSARKIDPEVRFWSYVIKTDGCWFWRSTEPLPNPRIRPQFFFKGRQYYVAVFSWMIANKRKVPKGKMVCHSCDIPHCVNPDHLWIGTALDNMRDCIAKGRFNFGSRGSPGMKHHKAVLTDDDVRFIRKNCVKGVGGKAYSGNTRELAEKYGISTTQVLNILRRSQWKHVPEEE